MTEKERQLQMEIERLQKKVRILSEAYNNTARELEQIKKQKKNVRRTGRPGMDQQLKARIVALYQQKNSMRQTAKEAGVSLGTVHRVIGEAAEKSRFTYVYMDRKVPATIIDVCGIMHRIKIVNLTDDMLSRAFGVRENPTWDDYEEFLESRCMPRTRYGIRDELKNLGLDSYDPFLIVEKTQGRVYGDGQWLWKMNLACRQQYDEVMERKISVEDRDKILRKLLEKESEG